MLINQKGLYEISEGVHQKVKSLLSNLESLHYKNCTVGRWKQTLYLFHYVKYNHLPHSLAPPPSFWSELRSILISEFVEMFPWFSIQRRKVSTYIWFFMTLIIYLYKNSLFLKCLLYYQLSYLPIHTYLSNQACHL